MKKPLLCCSVFLALTVFSTAAFAQPAEIPRGSECHACGMKVDPKSPFSAEIIGRDGRFMAFCDIGDMLTTYAKLSEKPDKVYVRDYNTGEWIAASTANYVKNSKFSTPMGWNIAAFKSMEEALKSGEIMTFDNAMETVSGMPMMKKKKMMH